MDINYLIKSMRDYFRFCKLELRRATSVMGGATRQAGAALDVEPGALPCTLTMIGTPVGPQAFEVVAGARNCLDLLLMG
jgi:hypothetical protein